jgi:chemotaxis protein CheX
MSTTTDVGYITPFMDSAIRAFETMFGWELEAGSAEINTHFHPRHEISGVIGLSGKIQGTMVISVTRKMALSMAHLLLQQEYTQITEDVIDAMGEITNIIGGGAKADMAEYALSLSLPTVIIGQNHVVTFSSSAQTVLVPLKCECGELTLEVGFTSPK